MKKLCKNCGAKIPKNSDICKKCGEPYEYIDLNLDPETEKAIQVEKPSNMLSICILLLSILIFVYSLVLIYLNFTNNRENPKNKLPDTSVSEELTEDENSETSSVVYSAIDFIGQPLSEVKKVLGDKYSIKISDTTLIVYSNFPVTLSTTDTDLTDDSIISKVILTGNAQVTPVVTADMTYDELKIVLGLTKPAPELDETDAFYYVRKVFENDNYQMDAAFKFDNEATDKAPLEITLSCDELIIKRTFGMVSGLDEDSWLNVRSQPSPDADVLVQLFNGDTVEILDSFNSNDNDWYEIETSSGTVGYASAEYILSDEEEPASEDDEEKTDEESDEENSDEDESSDEETDDDEDYYEYDEDDYE